jgi:hypothetical protein
MNYCMKIGEMQIRKGRTARIVSNGSVFGDLVQNSRTAFTRIFIISYKVTMRWGGGAYMYTRYGTRYRLDGRRLFISLISV